jgi:sugar-specific transcriptional regulator TrmB
VAVAARIGKTSASELIKELMKLGLSQYEASVYIGLVRGGEMTGYAVAKATGVPHAKVYENLSRLEECGHVVRIGSEPARYRAVTPQALLDNFQSEFQQSLESAKGLLREIANPDVTQEHEIVLKLTRQPDVVRCAADALAQAKGKVYLSGTDKVLNALGDEITSACDRGVEVILVHFGPLRFNVHGGRVVRHRSTEGIVAWRHQAQHLALCVDSTRSVWAVAKDGRNWVGSAGDFPPLAWLIKAYIRHDIYLQRVFADMPDELHERYGPSLSKLVSASMAEHQESLDQRTAAAPGAARKLRHVL